MFGYVLANDAMLSEEQKERYRACYCGLCKTISRRYGQLARLSLTYDMTFLILLLDSLHEPELRQCRERCMVHPARPQCLRASRWSEYAADMNVALAYHNCLDDWQDDHNVIKLLYAWTLKRAYRRIQRQWPEQCSCIETTLQELSALEQAKSADLDAAAQCFGRLMAGLFAVGDPFWREDLRQVGSALGQFIYVMDAVLDEEEDRKKGHYNPVSAFRAKYGSFDEGQTLTILIGACTVAFERLPLEQDLDLLRNILYSGVWARYVAARHKELEAAQEQNRENTDSFG